MGRNLRKMKVNLLLVHQGGQIPLLAIGYAKCIESCYKTKGDSWRGSSHTTEIRYEHARDGKEEKRKFCAKNKTVAAER